MLPVRPWAPALVEAATFPFLNGIARFLPNRKLAEVTDRLDTLEREFNVERLNFAERYSPRNIAATDFLPANLREYCALNFFSTLWSR